MVSEAREVSVRRVVRPSCDRVFSSAPERHWSGSGRHHPIDGPDTFRSAPLCLDVWMDIRILRPDLAKRGLRESRNRMAGGQPEQYAVRIDVACAHGTPVPHRVALSDSWLYSHPAQWTGSHAVRARDIPADRPLPVRTLAGQP